MSDFNLNLNQYGEQRSFDVIPAGTVVPLHIMIKRGGAGEAAGSPRLRTAPLSTWRSS
jgi:hypothetical protein